MRRFKKILAGLMAAALMCSAAPAALAASGSEQEDLLDILHQLYQEQAESEQETISFPALQGAVAASDDETDTEDEADEEESANPDFTEVAVDATAEITFGEPVIDEEEGTATVDVYVTAPNGVNGVQAYVIYGDLTYTGSENNDSFYVADVREASADNTLLLTFADADKMTADKLLLTTLSFTYEDATAGSEVTLSSNTIYVAYFEGYDADTNTYTTNLYGTVTEGTATVAIPEPEYTLGDVNGDGEVDIDDVTILARHVAGIVEISDTTLLGNADVNQSGEVDIDDVTLLARYVAGIIDTL